jgi:putative metallohydrolase (TIGR04338 family)
MRGENMTQDQAGKVYAAEALSGIKQHRETLTLKQCQVFTNKVISRKYVKDNYGSVSSILVLDGRGRRKACATYYCGQKAIKLPKWARNEFVILHEVAHHLTKLNGHKSEFASCLLDLVRHFIGRDAADSLQAAYHLKGVKIQGKNGPVKARCPQSRKQWVIDERINQKFVRELTRSR